MSCLASGVRLEADSKGRSSALERLTSARILGMVKQNSVRGSVAWAVWSLLAQERNDRCLTKSLWEADLPFGVCDWIASPWMATRTSRCRRTSPLSRKALRRSAPIVRASGASRVAMGSYGSTIPNLGLRASALNDQGVRGTFRCNGAIQTVQPREELRRREKRSARSPLYVRVSRGTCVTLGLSAFIDRTQSLRVSVPGSQGTKGIFCCDERACRSIVW